MEGRWGPLDVKHRHMKSNIKKISLWTTPRTHQAKDNPHLIY